MTQDKDNSMVPEEPTKETESVSPAPAQGTKRDPLIGTHIGSCTLKRTLGSGGMGTVYEAVQENPRRRVAVKMMKHGITSPSALRRFEFESQTLARLQHQGIAQVFEAGTHDDGSGGVPYFIMEYVSSAKSITAFADGKKLGTRDRLTLFSRVCDAVQHGHMKGIVHRDLKPTNILVDVKGNPKIIDFGVARSTDSDLAVTTLQTDVGAFIGTLQYMSPEQCEIDPQDIDTRSDVYALGVILYELLTGKPPYDVKKAAIHEAVQIIREAEPTRLSTIERHLAGDIETISLKALAKEREDRYQSAGALRDDIGRYLTDEPISAKPPSVWAQAKRFARRNQAAAIAAICVFAVLVGAVVVSSTFAIKANTDRVRAVEAEADAIRQRDLAKEHADASRASLSFLMSILNLKEMGDFILFVGPERIDELLSNGAISAREGYSSNTRTEQRMLSSVLGIIGECYQVIGMEPKAFQLFMESLRVERDAYGGNPKEWFINNERLIGRCTELLGPIDIPLSSVNNHGWSLPAEYIWANLDSYNKIAIASPREGMQKYVEMLDKETITELLDLGFTVEEIEIYAKARASARVTNTSTMQFRIAVSVGRLYQIAKKSNPFVDRRSREEWETQVTQELDKVLNSLEFIAISLISYDASLKKNEAKVELEQILAGKDLRFDGLSARLSFQDPSFERMTSEKQKLLLVGLPIIVDLLETFANTGIAHDYLDAFIAGDEEETTRITTMLKGVLEPAMDYIVSTTRFSIADELRGSLIDYFESDAVANMLNVEFVDLPQSDLMQEWIDAATTEELEIFRIWQETGELKLRILQEVSD